MRPPSGQTAESILLEVLELTKTFGEVVAVVEQGDFEGLGEG